LIITSGLARFGSTARLYSTPKEMQMLATTKLMALPRRRKN